MKPKRNGKILQGSAKSYWPNNPSALLYISIFQTVAIKYHICPIMFLLNEILKLLEITQCSLREVIYRPKNTNQLVNIYKIFTIKILLHLSKIKRIFHNTVSPKDALQWVNYQCLLLLCSESDSHWLHLCLWPSTKTKLNK